MRAGSTQALDAALVARCQRGDQEAWSQLVAQYAAYVNAITVKGFRLPYAEAEDAFQEIFLRVYNGLSALRSDTSFTAWISQVARRVCLDYVRGQRGQQPGELDDDEGDIDAALERIDEALALRQALGTLPPDCQQVLDRFFWRDQSYATIAAALSIPPGTVASRISRCLERLRPVLAGRKPAPGSSGRV